MPDLQQIELDIVLAYKKYIPLIDEESYVNGATIVKAIERYSSIIYNDIKKGLIEAGYNPDKPKQRHIHELTARVFYDIRPDFRRVKLHTFKNFWDNKEHYKIMAKNQLVAEQLEKLKEYQERKERVMAKWSARKGKRSIMLTDLKIEAKLGEVVEHTLPKEWEGIIVTDKPLYYNRTNDPVKIKPVIIDIKSPEQAVADRLSFQETLEIEKSRIEPEQPWPRSSQTVAPKVKYDSISTAYFTVASLNLVMLFGAMRYIFGAFS